MSQKVKIEIEVEVDGPMAGPDAKPENFKFVSLKVKSVDGQSIPLPPKDPAPRRLVADLALAAGNVLLGVKKSEPTSDDA